MSSIKGKTNLDLQGSSAQYVFLLLLSQLELGKKNTNFHKVIEKIWKIKGFFHKENFNWDSHTVENGKKLIMSGHCSA